MLIKLAAFGLRPVGLLFLSVNIPHVGGEFVFTLFRRKITAFPGYKIKSFHTIFRFNENMSLLSSQVFSGEAALK